MFWNLFWKRKINKYLYSFFFFYKLTLNRFFIIYSMSRCLIHTYWHTIFSFCTLISQEWLALSLFIQKFNFLKIKSFKNNPEIFMATLVESHNVFVSGNLLIMITSKGKPWYIAWNTNYTIISCILFSIKIDDHGNII